jgi:hypothetical protein
MGMFQPSSASAHKCRRRYLCLTFESHRPKHIDFKVSRRPLPSIFLYAQCSRVCFRKKLRLISSRFERQSFWNYVKEMVEVRKVKKGLPLAKEVQARAYFIYQVVQKTVYILKVESICKIVFKVWLSNIFDMTESKVPSPTARFSTPSMAQEQWSPEYWNDIIVFRMYYPQRKNFS